MNKEVNETVMRGSFKEDLQKSPTSSEIEFDKNNEKNNNSM